MAKARWPLVLPLAALLGCAGPSTVGPPYREAATWSEMVYATAHGPMLVQVVNDPFGGGAGRLAPVLAAEMSGQVQTRPFPFTADPGQAPHPDKRVAVLFDPAEGVSDYDLCAGRATARPPQGGHVTVLAAFCDHGERLSAVRGWVDGVSSPEDPRFRQLMAEVVRQLFGNDEETRRDGNGVFWEW